MKDLSKVVLLAAAFAVSGTAVAEDKIEASVGADVVSSYIWRGQDLGDAAIQPSVSLGYKGFELEAWGSYGIMSSTDPKEVDLALSYTVGGFSIGVTDYFISEGGKTGKYFLYDAHKTGHTFEANLSYDFGKFAVNWNTNFAGVDGVRSNGKRAYASYVEVSAPFRLGGAEWVAAVGATPYNSGAFYNDIEGERCTTGFAVQNVSVKASKDLKITPSFTLPVFGQLTANPSTQRMYFTFGLSF
jgi:hypothetical protein